jgi:extradiol dioxygenase family protein
MFNIFHLAIPCLDVDETVTFYEKLGARCGRRYKGYAILNFFGHQVVAHVNGEKCDKELFEYPRHFGIICDVKEQYDALLKLAEDHELSFFLKGKMRFEGRPEEHRTFFLKDPSNNLIEFKHYTNLWSVFAP